MLQLIVMRHAHAAGKAATDHARPLDAVGRQEAAAVAGVLDAARWRPSAILCSDALRTRETYDHMAAAWGAGAPAARFDPELYLAPSERLLDLIGELPQGVSRPMLLAHNPGCEEAVSWLTGLAVSMRTAHAALLRLPAAMTWTEAARSASRWQLAELARPAL